MNQELLDRARQLSLEFIEFVNKAVSPFHVVDQCKLRLSAAGFKELKETENWVLVPGGKYYFTRNLTTIFAFIVGEGFDPDQTGFKILGAHTDSPSLRLTPVSKLESQNVHQTCVATYGGGLWHTWFDRDLSLGGRVIYKNGDNFSSKLFHHPGSLFKIPNLAIHLLSADDRSKFAPNTETHLRPIISSEIYNQLAGIKNENASNETGTQKKHYFQLLNLIAKETGIEASQIVDLDLCFCDANPATLVGLNQEFISSPRIDNLVSSFFALKAITAPESYDPKSPFINLICLFDHEEIGSVSSQGADSVMLPNNLERIYSVLSNNKHKTDSYYKALARSFIISADMAHATHPNYSEKHQQNHRVKINEGIVVKVNHNQRYATDGASSALLRAIADLAKVPLQEFIVRNDSPCGSTIGPILSGQSGIKTIDIGGPQYGMHSIRETCGVVDTFYYHSLFVEYFKSFEKINTDLLGV